MEEGYWISEGMFAGRWLHGACLSIEPSCRELLLCSMYSHLHCKMLEIQIDGRVVQIKKNKISVYSNFCESLSQISH